MDLSTQRKRKLLFLWESGRTESKINIGFSSQPSSGGRSSAVLAIYWERANSNISGLPVSGLLRRLPGWLGAWLGRGGRRSPATGSTRRPRCRFSLGRSSSGGCRRAPTATVPLRSRFQAICTVTKTWRVNSADHWLAGENRHYCATELATRDPPLQPYPLDLNQHRQRRIGRNFCLNKRTFLHQPQNSSVVVCWGSLDVPLVDSRGADPVRAWWRDSEGKSLMYNITFELAIFSEYVFCLYFYLCICVLLQLKTIWSNNVPPDYIKYVLLYEHVMNLLKKTND